MRKFYPILLGVSLLLLAAGCSSLGEHASGVPVSDVPAVSKSALFSPERRGAVELPPLRMVPQTGLTGQVLAARISPRGERILVSQSDRRISLWSRDGSVLISRPGIDGVILPEDGGIALLSENRGSYFLHRLNRELTREELLPLNVQVPERGFASLLLRPGSNELYLIPAGSAREIPAVKPGGQDGELAFAAPLDYPLPFTLSGKPVFSTRGNRCAAPVHIEHPDAPPEGAILLWDLETRAVEKITIPSTDPLFDQAPLAPELLALDDQGSLLTAAHSQEGTFLVDLSGATVRRIEETSYVEGLTWSGGLWGVSVAGDTRWFDPRGNRVGSWKGQIILAEADESGELLLQERLYGSELILTDQAGRQLYTYQHRNAYLHRWFILDDGAQLEIFDDGSFRFRDSRFEPGVIHRGFQLADGEMVNDIAWNPEQGLIGAVISRIDSVGEDRARLAVLDRTGRLLWSQEMTDIMDSEPEFPLRRLRFSPDGEMLFCYYRENREEGRVFPFRTGSGSPLPALPAVEGMMIVDMHPLAGPEHRTLLLLRGRGMEGLEGLDRYKLVRYSLSGEIEQSREITLSDGMRMELSDHPWAGEGFAALIRQEKEGDDEGVPGPLVYFRGLDPADDLLIPLEESFSPFTKPIPSFDGSSFFLTASGYPSVEGSAVVVEISRGGEVLRLYGGVSTGVSSFYPPREGRGAALLGRDGVVRYYREDSASPLSLASDQEDWIAWTGDGLFMGSRNADRFLSMVMRGRPLGVDSFGMVMNRPDLILPRYAPREIEAINHFQAQYGRRLELLGQTSGDVEARVEQIRRVEGFDLVRIDSVNQEGGSCELSFSLAPNVPGVESYQLYLNHVPLFPSPGAPFSGGTGGSISFPLTEQRTLVEISVRDSRGLESFRESRVLFLENPPRGDLWYVGLGSSDYLDDSLDLSYAAKDARDLGELLGRIGSSGSFGQIHRRIFTDREIGEEALAEVEHYLSRTRPEDQVVLFMAGHGTYDRRALEEGEFHYYYLPWDGDPEHLPETAIPYSRLEELLSDIPARKRLMLVDTCESGLLTSDQANRYGISFAGDGLAPRGIAVIPAGEEPPEDVDSADNLFPVLRNRYIYNDLLRRNGATVFTSSRANELSWESGLLKNGLFTAALLQVLQEDSGDGPISLQELEVEVAGRVQSLSGGVQHPVIERENLEQELLLPRKKR